MAKDVTALAWDIWYVANKEYVASELCVNKAKPQLHCNGKCHLAKQLQKLEESPAKDQKSPVSGNLKLKEVDWISVNGQCAIITERILFFTSGSRNSWYEPNGAPHSFSTAVFHPPTA